MFKFARKDSQRIGDHPLADPLFFRHNVEVQTFTTDRGPLTLALSIAGSNFVRRSYGLQRPHVGTSLESWPAGVTILGETFFQASKLV